jgi:hypothetical protein
VKEVEGNENMEHTYLAFGKRKMKENTGIQF